MTARFEGFAKPRKWNARWIWGEGNGMEKNAFRYFRHEFDAPADRAGWRLFITADTRYQLCVNGRFLARGPLQSQPYFQYYDEVDVSEALVEGRNCLAIVVNHLGRFPGTRAGLLAELVDDRGKTVLSTGPDWRTRRAAAWKPDMLFIRSNQVTSYQECFDARLVPEGWERPGFDDASWDAARVVGARVGKAAAQSDQVRPPAAGPWTNLVPRDIPWMAEWEARPARVDRVEECLDIWNRHRSEDLSICLSAAGRPLEYATAESVGTLCDEGGEAVFRMSLNHLDGVFDGIHIPVVLLDFGRVLTGFTRIELDGVDGAMVDIGYAERLIDGQFNNAIEGSFADRYVMKDGPQTYQSFTWKGFRYMRLMFRDCPRPVRVRDVMAVVTTYPYKERGVFESGDETLNAVHGISKATLRLCSQEFIMDTPWREQGQWLGDVSAVSLGGVYACFGDTALPGKFLRQSGANQTPTGLITNMTNTVSPDWVRVIPDYSLWWVMAVWNHYLYTGERHWVEAFYPHSVKVIREVENHLNEEGLVEDMPYWVFIDWANVEKRGECAPFNAIFVGACEALRSMASLKGDAYVVEEMDRVVGGVRAAFEAAFYDEGRGCFVDARIDGERSEMASEHANAAAIRWGLCDDDLGREIVARRFEERSLELTEAQPFFHCVLLPALDRLGRGDLALRIVRERWGERMVARGYTSTLEEWTQNGSRRFGTFKGFLRTHSHAWSGYPAEYLIRGLLGIEILEAGCRKVRARPRRTEFDYRAVFPTPLGTIEGRCEGGRVSVEATGEGMELVVEG